MRWRVLGSRHWQESRSCNEHSLRRQLSHGGRAARHWGQRKRCRPHTGINTDPHDAAPLPLLPQQRGNQSLPLSGNSAPAKPPAYVAPRQSHAAGDVFARQLPRCHTRVRPRSPRSASFACRRARAILIFRARKRRILRRGTLREEARGGERRGGERARGGEEGRRERGERGDPGEREQGEARRGAGTRRGERGEVREGEGE